MGIYIKNITKDDLSENGALMWGKQIIFIPPEDIISVSDHGRLIDADAAIYDIRCEILEHQMNGMKGTPVYTEDLRTMWQRLEDEDLIPTVIPAERSENGET